MRTTHRIGLLAWTGWVLTLAAVGAPGLDARELHWRRLEVRAFLDIEGRLEVREEHTMVFDGNWNGGERTFAMRAGQKLVLRSVERQVDGQFVALTQGDLDHVDHWDWGEGVAVRWRSRYPSDPVFDQEEIVYALEYTLENVLLVTAGGAGGYELDHDFAFKDRVGVIENFVLAIELAPEWTPAVGFESRHEAQNLQPGFSMPLSVGLVHDAQRPLAGVLYPVGPSWRHAVLAITLTGIALMLFAFMRRERELGRFESVEAPPALDTAWLEEHVLSWKPEEIGALWDEKIGAPEVAALIARWCAEGKLASKTVTGTGFFGLCRRRSLELELLARQSAFSGHEGRLIAKLFFKGRKTVTPQALRKRYRSSGFRPASIIEKGVERAVKDRLGREHGPNKPKALRTLSLFVVGAVLVAIEMTRYPDVTFSWGLVTSLAWLLPLWVGISGALRWRKRVESLRAGLLWMVVPAVALALVYWWMPWALLSIQPRQLGTAALACFVLGTFSFFVNQASTRVSPRRLRQRARLAVVRRWWQRELERERPMLSDDYFPYLIALELDHDVDRWFSDFGGSAESSPTLGRPSTTFGSGSGTSSWTGGGGTFGGAGATAAWTAAATGIAGGVAAASSSSGSSGGSSGGSSSGGGGGGGW